MGDLVLPKSAPSAVAKPASISRMHGGNAESARILKSVERLKGCGPRQLREDFLSLRWSAKTGMSARKLARRGFPLIVEATRQALGMTHYPVQVLGALRLTEGRVIEMQTGEGKTITAALAAAAMALPGYGCHVITSNDYLAKRDAESLRPMYERLGLSVGCVDGELSPDERKQQYACDITYGTGTEFGFDFLRDRMAAGVESDRFFSAQHEQSVQRGHYVALIDEADSILIDDARTPLIIGIEDAIEPSKVALCRWSATARQHLTEGADYLIESTRKTVFLTKAGCRFVDLMRKPIVLGGFSSEQIYDAIEKSLTAANAYLRDRDYVVLDGEVAIVSESTGRSMQGRKWQDGLHQAIEAKEDVEITAPTVNAARITMQSYFGLYQKLAGLTGTAKQVRGELKKYYRVGFREIPTNRPGQRRQLAARVFATEAAKLQAIAREIHELRSQGRAVLVGTPSVEVSERIGEALQSLGIEFALLNAINHDEEAEIVSQAGQVGRVTVATNMAGRGTDIELADAVHDNGGLHVIATALHSSKRIDRQLIGRCARQGNPGSCQFFLSLDDELLNAADPATVEMIRQQAVSEDGELGANWWSFFRQTQKRIEKQARKGRKTMFKHEKEKAKKHRLAGLDPYLEIVE